MDVISLLRAQQSSRAEDANGRYWQAITKLASREPLSRTQEKPAIEALDKAATELGKTLQEVDCDLRKMREFNSIDQKGLLAKRSEFQRLAAEANSRITKMEQAMDKANNDLCAARAEYQSVASSANHVCAQAERVQELSRDLLSTGCPPTIVSVTL